MSQRSKHNHNFLLKSVKHPFYCQRCGQFGFGMSYSCEGSECNLFIHKECENPKSVVKHPFSKKCVLKFYTNTSEKGGLCDVCGKGIKGYHYRCSCNFIKRNAHPSCLTYEPTLEAFDGLTMKLHKVASAKCLHCEDTDVCSKVRGWAYVSPCEMECYHAACVMDIIHENWKEAFIDGTSDPFQTIRKRFPADVNRRRKIATGKKKNESKWKKADAAVNLIINMLLGSPKGIYDDAKKFFGK